MDADFEQHYQAAERAYGLGEYAKAQALTATLWDQLQSASNEHDPGLILGWRAVVSLLLGHIQLHGLQQPEQAAISYERVLQGDVDATIAALADNSISLDAIVQSERQHNDGSRDITFILRKDDRARADVALAPLLAQWPGAALEDGEAIARVSAVGAGMPATPGTAGRMFRALADAGINIGLIATSEIRTSCVVAENAGVQALQVVHAGFGLGGEERHTAQGSPSPQDPSKGSTTSAPEN